MAIERLCRRDKEHGTARDTGGSWFQNRDFDAETLGWLPYVHTVRGLLGVLLSRKMLLDN